MQFIFYIIIFSLPLIGHAEDVFKWTDEMGNVHFSNSPNEDPAKKTNLPEIKKIDIDTRINELKSVSNQTCINRGGINCEAKADTDGSVICMDGSLDSNENFGELCTEVRLTADILLPPKSQNKMLKFFPVAVMVRNNSAITAHDVRVEVRILKNLAKDTREKLILEGPQEIPPFGIIEYTYSGRTFDERILRKSNISVTCNNCWNPARPIETSQTGNLP